MTEEQILNIARKFLKSEDRELTILEDYNGYKVVQPDYGEGCFGTPYFVLIDKNQKARFSDTLEGLKIYHRLIS